MTGWWSDLIRFADETCLRWVLTLLHFVWQGAVIGVTVMMTEKILTSASAKTRYLLNFAAILCMPASFAMTFALISATPSTAESMSVSPLRMTQPQRRMVTDVVNDDTSAVAIPAELTPTIDATRTEAIIRSSNAISTWLAQIGLALGSSARFVTIVYFLGAFYFLSRLGLALRGGHQLRLQSLAISDPALLELFADQARRIGLKFVPIVCFCERVAVPTVIGVVKPAVLLPVWLMGVDLTLLSAVVSHEFSHLRRYDLQMNLIQRVIESLLFFHPAVWYVSRRISAQRELCCDDLVLASGQNRLNYAAALLEVADSYLQMPSLRETSLAASGNTRSEFESRIQRLINGRESSQLQLTRSGWSLLIGWLAVILMAPVIFHSFAGATPPSPFEDGETVAFQPATESVDVIQLAQKNSDGAVPEPNESSRGPSHPITVLCVDAEGNPVEGAEVHLFQNLREGAAQCS